MNRNLYKALFGACLLLIIGGVSFLTLQVRSKSSSNPAIKTASDNQWKTVFEDEFFGDSLNRDNWTTCYEWFKQEYGGCSNNGNNEMEWYKSSQVQVKDGNLVLLAKKENTTGWDGTRVKDYQYISGMVSSGRVTLNEDPKWDGTFGKYEARIKMPGGKGIWPAFWLLPTDKKWPPEIDIMELVGDKPRNILLTYHYGDTTKPQKDETIFSGENFTEGWHVYQIEWQPGKIEWRVDGELRKTATGTNIPTKKMQIILNLAVGGKLPGNPDASTVFPAEMLVDYVRVQQLRN